MTETLPPDTVWIVTFFNRARYIDVEVVAPHSDGAEMFALRSLVADGEIRGHLTWIKTERQT